MKKRNRMHCLKDEPSYEYINIEFSKIQNYRGLDFEPDMSSLSFKDTTLVNTILLATTQKFIYCKMSRRANFIFSLKK